MLLNQYLYIVTIILIGNLSLAQEKVNQYDDNGKRHGPWKKYYDNSDQLRYEGTFEHGKEIGVFKFYCGDCEDRPTVIKTYNDNDRSAHVQFFTIKGKLVSEGKMIDKDRIGEWVYYHKSSDKVMTREFYKKGKLEGTFCGQLVGCLKGRDGKREFHQINPEYILYQMSYLKVV